MVFNFNFLLVSMVHKYEYGILLHTIACIRVWLVSRLQLRSTVVWLEKSDWVQWFSRTSTESDRTISTTVPV